MGSLNWTEKNPDGMEGLKSDMDPTRDARKRLAEELGKGEYDQGLADQYYGERESGINSSFHNASRTAAANMGKRGLGTSGMAIGQQADMSFAAAAQKAAAKKRAIDAAKDVRRQGLMDEYGVWSDFADANATKAKLAEQDAARDDAKFWSLVGLGVGGGL
jgi:hypothetical protein